MCSIDCALDGGIYPRRHRKLFPVWLFALIVGVLLCAALVLAQEGDSNDMSDMSSADFGDMPSGTSDTQEVDGECCMDMADLDFPGSQDGYAPGTGPAGHSIGSEFSTSGEGE